MMRAIGLSPFASASDSFIMIIMAAPSEIDDDEAAVTVPSLLNAGFNEGIFSGLHRPGGSSVASCTSPPFPDTVTGAISATKAPLATAPCARLTLSAAKASWSARVKPYLAAVASAKMPMDLPS